MTRLAAILLVVLLIAAPRPELHVIPASGPRIALSAPWSSSSESANLGASTTKPLQRERPPALVPLGVEMQKGPTRISEGGDYFAGLPHSPVIGTPAALSRIPVMASASPREASMPAIFQTTATWCAPTPTLCHGWGGNAKLAALPGFHGKPYRILVTYGSRAVIVTVVSVCWCGVDLSPFAFASLAPLSKGQIVVTVRGPIADAPLPATDTGPWN